jgi:hypothetical protein
MQNFGKLKQPLNMHEKYPFPVRIIIVNTFARSKKEKIKASYCHK